LGLEVQVPLQRIDRKTRKWAVFLLRSGSSEAVGKGPQRRPPAVRKPGGEDAVVGCYLPD
jgi:hypothetical protein